MAVETSTLGGGCFWCLEAVYEQLQGVQKVVSGYAGGKSADPTYEEVSTGVSGHVEVVQITFDPAVVSFREILEVFFTIHDPTTLDRQGADVGPQYASVVFAHNEAQAKQANAIIGELNHSGEFTSPIVTRVEALKKFYAAEGYHQTYYRNNPNQPYCRFVISPKLAKFRKAWAQRLKPAAK